jgi:hypothetical protein
METINNSLVIASYIEFHNRACSPYVVEARESISEYKKPGFTHLANLIEFACKRCLNSNLKISNKDVKTVIEAAIRVVLGYPINSKNIFALEQDGVLEELYTTLITFFSEEHSMNYLDKLANQTGLFKSLQYKFNFEIKYTSSISKLINFGEQWSSLLKTDSHTNYGLLEDFFCECQKQSKLLEVCELLPIREKVLQGLMYIKKSANRENRLEYNVSSAKVSILQFNEKLEIFVVYNSMTSAIRMKKSEIDKYWAILKKIELGRIKYDLISTIVRGFAECFKQQPALVYLDFARKNQTKFIGVIYNLSIDEQKKLRKALDMNKVVSLGQDEVQTLAIFFYKNNKQYQELFFKVKRYAETMGLDPRKMKTEIRVCCFIENTQSAMNFIIAEEVERNDADIYVKIITDCFMALEA